MSFFIIILLTEFLSIICVHFINHVLSTKNPLVKKKQFIKTRAPSSFPSFDYSLSFFLSTHSCSPIMPLAISPPSGLPFRHRRPLLYSWYVIEHFNQFSFLFNLFFNFIFLLKVFSFLVC